MLSAKMKGIAAIDFSSMLFGTAAMHPRIGLDCFQKSIPVYGRKEKMSVSVPL